MRRHVLSSLIALVAVVSLASTLAAQAPVTAKPAPAAKAWTMPRTPDGKPDLQGVYSNATLSRRAARKPRSERILHR